LRCNVGQWPGPATDEACATAFLLRRFTAYMAASAARNNSSGVRASSGYVATPTLAVTVEMSMPFP